MYDVMLVDVMISRRHIARMDLWNRWDSESPDTECRMRLIFRSRNIDLLITDIKMPKIDGIELLKEVTVKTNALASCF